MDTAFRNIDDLTSRYAKQLKEGFRRLYFSEELEKEFREHFNEQLLTRVRAGLIIGLIAFGAFGIWDYNSLPSAVTWWSFLIRFGLVCPLLLFTWFVSGHKKYQKFTSYFIFLSVLTAGLGIVAIIFVARIYQAPLPYEGLILLTMGTYLLTGLLFSRACFCSALVFFAYLFSEFFVDYPLSLLSSHIIFLFFANVIGMCGNYTIERMIRTNYLKTKLLEELADRDGLTGIYNRRMLDQYLQRIWAQGCREKKSITFAMIDVDHFKAFNDHYGHLSGDECLKRIARALSLVTRRPLDFAARYGGEEFALVRYNAKIETAKEFGEDIRNTIAMLNIENQLSPVSQYVTVSVGIAYTIPEESYSPKDFIKKADEALYQAKEGGRDQVFIQEYPVTSMQKASIKK